LWQQDTYLMLQRFPKWSTERDSRLRSRTIQGHQVASDWHSIVVRDSHMGSEVLLVNVLYRPQSRSPRENLGQLQRFKVEDKTIWREQHRKVSIGIL